MWCNHLSHLAHEKIVLESKFVLTSALVIFMDKMSVFELTVLILNKFSLTQVPLTIERVYGSQDSIQVRYTTTSSTATAGLDFVNIANGAINMEPASTSAVIYVQVRWSWAVVMLHVYKKDASEH